MSPLCWSGIHSWIAAPSEQPRFEKVCTRCGVGQLTREAFLETYDPSDGLPFGGEIR